MSTITQIQKRDASTGLPKGDVYDIGGGAGDFIATVTYDAALDEWSSDKDYAEIIAAAEAGQNVIFNIIEDSTSRYLVPLTNISDGRITANKCIGNFQISSSAVSIGICSLEMFSSGSVDVSIKYDVTGALGDLDTTDKSNLVGAINEVYDMAQSGGGAEVFEVKLTRNGTAGAYTWTVDKTNAEIFAAYEAGKEVICTWAADKLELVVCAAAVALFRGLGTFTRDKTSVCTLMITTENNAQTVSLEAVQPVGVDDIDLSPLPVVFDAWVNDSLQVTSMSKTYAELAEIYNYGESPYRLLIARLHIPGDQVIENLQVLIASSDSIVFQRYLQYPVGSADGIQGFASLTVNSDGTNVFEVTDIVAGGGT